VEVDMRILNKIREKKVEKLIEELEKNTFFLVKPELNKFNFNNDYTVKYFIDKFILELEKGNIKMNDFIEIIDYFYECDNNYKFNIFKSLFEKLYLNNNFINGYEESFYRLPINLKINEDNYKDIIDLFLDVLEKYDNSLSCNICQIIVVNDKYGKLLTKEQKNRLVKIINKKISNYSSNFGDDKEYMEEYYRALFFLASYINNKKTIEIVNEKYKDDLPNDIKIHCLNFKFVNKIEVSKKEINKMFEDIESTCSMLDLLEYLGKTDLIPKKCKFTQEDIAVYKLVEWLKYPTELGQEPDEIKVVDKLEMDGYVFYICSFTCLKNDSFKKKGNMIGISGGFEKGKFTADSICSPFSEFETIGDNCIEQAENLINTLMDWFDEENN
jgi:hypothetical protein